MGHSPSRALLLCIPTLEGGGAERQAAYLARGLAEKGWRVAVALIRPGPNAAYLSSTSVEILPLAYQSHYDPRLFLELNRVSREFQPQIIHTWLGMMDVLGGLVALASGRPWVASERASFHEGVMKERARRRILALRADVIVANSEAGRAYIRQFVGRKIPTYVIPNGVPVDQFGLEEPLPRSALNAPADSELVLFAGRFTAVKNVETLLRAVPLIAEARPRAVVACCGIGPLRSQAIALSKQLGIEERVRFPGYVRDLARWMRTCDVLVSASHYEGHPNVLLEAMAAGIPVVASDIPAHLEMLSENCALLFDPRSPSELARAVITALDDRHGSRRRAAEARRAVGRYDIDSMVNSYESLYEDILKGGVRRRAWRLQYPAR